MTDQRLTAQQKRIDELESKAVESALIAELATDPEVRIYNARLAQELRDAAKAARSKSKAR